MPKPDLDLKKVFSVNITPGMSGALDARAARDGVKRGEVVRVAIGQYLDNPMDSNGFPSAGEIADAVAERLREYPNGYPLGIAPVDEPADLPESTGTLASDDAISKLRATLSGEAEPEEQWAHLPEMPEPWAAATVNTDMLRQLQERPALDAALAVVRRAAESGELDRDVLAGIVAARWDLKPGDRMKYDDGHLFREQAPVRKRRSVQHRAE
jgi:hypothetical protein